MELRRHRTRPARGVFMDDIVTVAIRHMIGRATVSWQEAADCLPPHVYLIIPPPAFGVHSLRARDRCAVPGPQSDCPGGGGVPPAFQEHTRIITGHAAGLTTIDIAEADDAERERHRRDMAESYRTLLGHFRHEVGHYYWDRLVRSGPRIAAFRDLFGDERQDYQACLSTHYAQGPPAGWQQHHVSGYASAHPGRTSPRRGRITCTSWTRSRQPASSASVSGPG